MRYRFSPGEGRRGGSVSTDRRVGVSALRRDVSAARRIGVSAAGEVYRRAGGSAGRRQEKHVGGSAGRRIILHFRFWRLLDVFGQLTPQRFEESSYADTPIRRPADTFLPQPGDTFSPKRLYSMEISRAFSLVRFPCFAFCFSGSFS